MHPKYLLYSASLAFSAMFVIILLTSDCKTTLLAKSNIPPSDRSIEVAFLIFATGNYIKYALVFIKTMRKYFYCPMCNVTYVVFSDVSNMENLASDIKLIPYQLKGWPYDTLKRVHAFIQSKSELDNFDYLFAIDADMRATSRVGMEILGDLVGTLHPGYYNNKIKGTFENNTHSSAYVDPSEGGQYFAGGFYGGMAREFWNLCEGVSKLIDTDLEQDYIAVWHDESYLNRFFLTHPPVILLSPAYCAPERWSLPFTPKIVARSKRHAIARLTV